MQSFEQYGKLSGYKINLGKTQYDVVCSYDYSQPGDIENRYPLAWQIESFLGNYLPRHNKTEKEIKR